ncbi:MAG TPA: MFS transporter [Gaiellaceae bacterium]
MTRYRWTILGAGTCAQATFSAVAVGLPALAPALRSHYGLSLNEVGVVIAAVGIGMVLTLLPWGLLADRVGERVVIAAGLAGAAGAIAATAFAGSFASLVALLALAGALGASVNAASGRAVMGWFSPAERGLALGIRQTAIPIGGATAAAALPWLAQAGGVRLAFLVLGAACFGGALVGAVLMRDAPPTAEPDRHVVLAAAPLRDRSIWLLSGSATGYVTGQIAVMGFVVLFLHEHRGLATGVAAAVLAGTHVLGAVARIVVGRWSDRLGTRIALLRTLGLALALALVVATLLVDAPLDLLIPALLAAGVLGLSWNGLSFTATAELAGVARSGAALGLQQTVLGVGSVIAPIVFAAVAASSWRTAFALSALGPVVGVLALRAVPEPSPVRPTGARTLGTSASPQAARGTPD